MSDNRFFGLLARHELEPEVFLPVFEKCKDWTRLSGDEYHIAEQLFKIGLMAVQRVPIWNKTQSHIGNEVKFKSMTL